MARFYKDYSDFLAEHFSGKMQKLTVSAALSCPNRDGTIGRGGCVYCNNETFSPNFQMLSRGITDQLQAGKNFFARKYPEMRYLAYFQSYTNTHGSIGELIQLYKDALLVDGVEGLIIGTRPDCVSDMLLDALVGLGKPIFMEYGAETSHDTTLELINRCHTWSQTVDAVVRTASRGLPVGVHFIMGLPGESEQMMLRTIERAAQLPISTIKFHQLQIVRGTAMASEMADQLAKYCDKQNDPKRSNELTFRGKSVTVFSIEEYINLCVKMVEILREHNPAIAIERFTSQSPDNMLLAPRWGLKNYQFVNLLERILRARFSE